jgi:hypothetical protein
MLNFESRSIKSLKSKVFPTSASFFLGNRSPFQVCLFLNTICPDPALFVCYYRVYQKQLRSSPGTLVSIERSD